MAPRREIDIQLGRAMRAIKRDLTAIINLQKRTGKLKTTVAKDLMGYTKLLSDAVKDADKRDQEQAKELSRMSKEDLEKALG